MRRKICRLFDSVHTKRLICRSQRQRATRTAARYSTAPRCGHVPPHHPDDGRRSISERLKETLARAWGMPAIGARHQPVRDEIEKVPGLERGRPDTRANYLGA